jgi:hypothetical protein
MLGCPTKGTPIAGTKYLAKASNLEDAARNYFGHKPFYFWLKILVFQPVIIAQLINTFASNQ